MAAGDSLKEHWKSTGGTLRNSRQVLCYPSQRTHQSRARCAWGWGPSHPSTVTSTDPNDGVFHHHGFHSFTIHLHPGRLLGGILKLHKDLQNNIENWGYHHRRDRELWHKAYIYRQVSYNFKLCSMVPLLLKKGSGHSCERTKICMDIMMQII